MDQEKLERVEIDLFLEAIYQRYGYDFRKYTRASIRRRIRHRLRESGLTHIAEMIPKVLHDGSFFRDFLSDMARTVTEMFRDPTFFLEIRRSVLPHFNDRSVIDIWHPGCATGEEVYSLAMILAEEQLLETARVEATDIHSPSLELARLGKLQAESSSRYEDNYLQAGGLNSLTDYYVVKRDGIYLREDLTTNMSFRTHNLISDGCIRKMDLIVCRNLLVYFESELRDDVLAMFLNSLNPGGFLCLGYKESLTGTSVEASFDTVSEDQRIYRLKNSH